MSDPMPNNKSLEKWETATHSYVIYLVPSGSPPKYNIQEKSFKTGKFRTIGNELPYNYCLDIVRKKNAKKQPF